MFRDYIKALRSSGYYSFTIKKALSDLDITKNALKCAIYKLKKNGEIISPAKGFYVIIPVEYQELGCLPAAELVPILMSHLNLNYYACLLSAAQYYGASHQKPQIFQVMVSKQIKTRRFGKIKIEFIYQKKLKETFIQQRTVKTGYLNISSPELTIKDMLLYPNHAGGLNNIATVLSELLEAVDLEKLRILLKIDKKPTWMQRLGYFLEHIETDEPEKQEAIIDDLCKKINILSPSFLPLSPEVPIEGKPQDRRWKIIENTTIDGDL